MYSIEVAALEPYPETLLFLKAHYNSKFQKTVEIFRKQLFSNDI